MKLPDAQEMRELDQSAINDFNIPGIILMENAGVGTVQMMIEELGSPANSFALIFIGPGNNGGDGLVIGRHLHQRGCKPIFFFLVDPDSLQGDAASNMRIVRKLRLPFHIIDSESRVQTLPVLYKQFVSRGIPCYAIIDALFGTGLSRPLIGHFAETIHFINSSDSVAGIPVVAVDIPSGMDSDHGKIQGICLRANYTATYGCAQPGHVMHHGPEFSGKIKVIDIGIPPECMEKAKISTELLDAETVSNLLKPLKRIENVHKGSHGHLAVLAGSLGKTGAATLAVKGALRTGTGLVSLFAPKELNSIYEGIVIESMTIALPASTTCLAVNDLTFIKKHLKDKQALIIGPGIGTDPATAELVLDLYKTIPQPIILDADALNILALNKESLPVAAGPRILTPHPGEMARLIGESIEVIQDNRVQAAKTGCELYSKNRKDCILVLKGAGTIMTSSAGLTYINTSGNPGMATGGMGDVLTGVIAGLLCQGMHPEEASAAGVYIHGMAGDSLYDKVGFGYSASELADNIPLSIKELLKVSTK